MIIAMLVTQPPHHKYKQHETEENIERNDQSGLLDQAGTQINRRTAHRRAEQKLLPVHAPNPRVEDLEALVKTVMFECTL